MLLKGPKDSPFEGGIFYVDIDLGIIKMNK